MRLVQRVISNRRKKKEARICRVLFIFFKISTTTMKMNTKRVHREIDDKRIKKCRECKDFGKTKRCFLAY